MVRQILKGSLVWLWLGGCLGLGPATALAQETVGPDPADVAAALDELEAAGAPPSAAEVSDFMAGATEAIHGNGIVRLGVDSAGRLDETCRVDWHRGLAAARLRWRRDRWGLQQAAGAVSLGREPWHLVAGQVGLNYGFGLLVGRPGRGLSLSADSGLGFRTQQLVPWAGAATQQTVRGVGLQTGARGWALRGLIGRRGPEPGTVPTTELVEIAKEGEGGLASLVLLRDVAETGVSFAGRGRHAQFSGSWEIVWRLPATASRAVGAILVQSGWRGRSGRRLEILAGWSGLGPRPVMGLKHPVLGNWAGAGFAVRGTWRFAQGVGVKLLLQEADGRQDVAAGQRQSGFLADLQLNGQWGPGCFGAIRWRTQGTKTVTWSERFPWLPPQETALDRRQVLSLKGGWRQGRERLQALWRRLTNLRVGAAADWTGPAERSLLAFSGIHELNSAWLLRAAWTLAWGGTADLVSAAVPFSGFVLPRHWGHWRQEQSLGVEYRGHVVRWRGAVARRQAAWEAEPGDDGDDLAVWLEGGLYW